MSRSNITIIAAVVIIVGLIAAAALAYSFLKPTEEASAPIEAVPISETQSENEDAESLPAAEDSAGESEEDAGEITADSGETGASTDGQPTGESQPDTAEAAQTDEEVNPTSEAEATSGEAILFQIVQDDSEARFSIDEVLRGNPKTVIGVTDQVAGEILFNPADLSTAEVGTILVNARTIQTDDNNRNRAIGNRILETGTYEFISFTPTSIAGLPESVGEGQTISFQIMGDLTIREITKEVTFEAEVTFVSGDRLEGTAATVILREDFGLIIPDVPFVANVGEEVGLEIDFVASTG
ncbi:MAG: YceI family protein [Candidatus Promineifilaceae bacterium]